MALKTEYIGVFYKFIFIQALQKVILIRLCTLRNRCSFFAQRPLARTDSGNLFEWLRRGKEGDLLLFEWFENKQKGWLGKI